MHSTEQMVQPSAPISIAWLFVLIFYSWSSGAPCNASSLASVEEAWPKFHPRGGTGNLVHLPESANNEDPSPQPPEEAGKCGWNCHRSRLNLKEDDDGAGAPLELLTSPPDARWTHSDAGDWSPKRLAMSPIDLQLVPTEWKRFTMNAGDLELMPAEKRFTMNPSDLRSVAEKRFTMNAEDFETPAAPGKRFTMNAKDLQLVPGGRKRFTMNPTDLQLAAKRFTMNPEDFETSAMKRFTMNAGDLEAAVGKRFTLNPTDLQSKRFTMNARDFEKRFTLNPDDLESPAYKRFTMNVRDLAASDLRSMGKRFTMNAADFEDPADAQLISGRRKRFTMNPEDLDTRGKRFTFNVDDLKSEPKRTIKTLRQRVSSTAYDPRFILYKFLRKPRQRGSSSSVNRINLRNELVYLRDGRPFIY